ncbi:amine oxidase [Thalassoporum mexicanum PCC 7367]|uniref:NAD(P)/FAD-dependent oxidoreductase n=1 Tax=Thalassoporum mexicanum TaxID=3457544 RepID=UPI00029FCF91|nr:FAD-dependent oxidoreductase [Pseudanabaena sp. PCC 7367]AFY69080.1 amine oxidase [Pseudanabaena sp. PCC 7367]
MKDAIIIGAGLSGLVCGQQLRNAGLDVAIVEKSAGVGGRMATRRLQGTWVDHGAQYLTVRDDGFGRFIDKLQEKNVVQPWTRIIHKLTPEGLQPPAPDEMYPRYACPKGMTAIAKFLAAEQQIALSTRVNAVNYHDRAWHLITDNQEPIVTKSVVCTVPAPQMLPIFEPVLAAAPSFVKALQSIRFAPCLSLMAGYADSESIPTAWQAIRVIDDPILSWIAIDSSKHPDQAKQPVFVLQSTAEFARQSLEESNLELAGKPLLQQAGKLLAKWIAEPKWWQVHRWRYAFAEEALGVACLSTAEPLPLVCAGDWCAGQNVEGAYQSGLAAADSLLELIS